MKVDKAKAIRKEIAGQTLYFCGEHCAHKATANQDVILASSG